MGIPQEQKFDVVQFKQDKASYDYWFRHQFGVDDEDATQKISNTIYAAIRCNKISQRSDKQCTVHMSLGYAICGSIVTPTDFFAASVLATP